MGVQGEAGEGPEAAQWGPRTEEGVHLEETHGQGARAEGVLGDVMSSWKAKWGVLEAAAGTGGGGGLG